MVIGGLVALIVLLALVLVFVSAGDDDGEGDDVATGTSTTSTSEPPSTTTSSTTTSSTSSTTSTTTSSSPPSSTTTTSTTAPATTAPPATVAPARCTGRTGPQDPDPVAQVFYEAWTLDDRACAARVATDAAVEDLFVFPGEDAEWSFEGCTEVDEQPPTRCHFRYEGGSAAFAMQHGPIDGWQIESVTFTAD